VRLRVLQVVYRLHEKELAARFSNCFRTLTTELNCDLAIAEEIKKDFKTLDLSDEEMNISGLIYALLHLKPESLQLIYPFLTRLKGIEGFQATFSRSDASFKKEVKDFLFSSKRIASNPDFMKIFELNSDIKQEPKLYRLCGIMQMALQK
jgi:hypothetical protein